MTSLHEPTVLYLAVAALTLAISVIGWFIVDKVKRIEGTAYKALTKAEVHHTEILRYINEMVTALRAEREALKDTLNAEAKKDRHDIRDEWSTHLGKIELRLVDLERHTAALQAYQDAGERKST